MLKIRRHALAFLATVTLTSFTSVYAQSPVTPASAAFRESPAWTSSDGVLTTNASGIESALVSRSGLADSLTSFEFRAPKGARATVFMAGRYAFELEGNGDWQSFSAKFRSPRFDEGYNKIENAFALEARIGTEVRRNIVFEKASPNARWDAEDSRGPMFIVVAQGPFSIRNARHDAADFAQLKVPKASGGDTNEKELVDFVSLGKQTFESVGCSACHLVEANSGGVSTGPNLFGLFRPNARSREVVEGGEGHRFQVKANREYLLHSVRAPADQLAVAETGPTKGQPYLPVMPPFSTETVTDQQLDAIGDYLATLNEPPNRGPAMRLAALVATAPYDPMTDGLQWLVNDRVRMQRGPLAGVSARSIHVGNPNGVNYTFDPRLLAVAKIWQGGFLDMAGELTGRGGRGLALGYESREISFGDREYLLAPLNPAGKPIDFSFKEAKFGDYERLRAALNSKEDQLAQIAAVDAQFLGYSRDSRDKLAPPAFKYRVGKNVLEVATSIADNGTVTIAVSGDLATPQQFTLNPELLQKASASTGKIEGDRWTLPAGKTRATLSGNIALAAKAWRPAASTYAYQRAPLVKAPAKATLPAGYSIENYYPPKDNYGRDQLFEALGISLTKDNTLVVATRTAGVWRLVNGEWRLFAEGLFDSLGVVAEDAKGLVVVAGQKAELTRISDTNGDGLADRYETLFDAHSYHGNYHTYMHGPVRAANGDYYFALNLAHDGTEGFYTGGGKVMGTWGGFNGWAVRVHPNGKFDLFANGLRSPASLGFSPDGRLWYTDNQGDFVGTSKMYELKKDKFYGHPAGLVDLPGMTPASPEIQWEQVAGRKEKPVILFPHNRVANSPGNPVWVTNDKFGPFAGQILMGDQTQSNLLRVAIQKVGDVEEGSVMPFFEGLESGVMRPVFLPDGSLLLGQTGRGWQAKGGKVASLQHVRWDGKTIAPGIKAMVATPVGFRIDLTQPLASSVNESSLSSALSLESWTYRDAPDYGSDELDLHPESTTAITIGADRKSIAITLTSLEQKVVHPRQLARVYHAKLAAQTLFDANAPAQLDAYYSLRKFPEKE
jgi:mono/diheme cytochrome c family protein